MKSIKMFLVILLLLSSSVFSVSSVKAETESNGSTFVESAKIFQEKFEVLESKDAKKYYKEALKFVKQKNIKVSGDLKKKGENYTVFQSDIDDLTVVSVNLVEDNEEMHSLVITFENGKVIDSNEMIIKQKDTMTGNITIYKNGNISLNQDIEIKEDEISTFGALKTWNKFTNCLTNHGVATWAINALEVACGITCIASAGTLCVACIIGSASFFSGKVGYCIGYIYHN